MKRFITFAVLLFSMAAAFAKGGQPEFFARVMADRNGVLAGDSMLVSVVLYSQYPIAEAECTTTFKVSGKGNAKCTARRLGINRNATASRTREGRNVYYTLVWDQYVVAPDAVGTYTIPSLKFSAKLQQVVRMPDLFDQMMGASPEYRTHKVSGSSESFTFEAKEKPRRSTRDILSSGGTML